MIRRSILATALCALPLALHAAATNHTVILTSFHPIYIHAINIVGDTPGIEVINLAQPVTGCLHDYQATTEDMVKINQADIFVMNGAGMESFAERALQASPGITVIEASRGLDLIYGNSGTPNPHVWVGVSGAIGQVSNIAAALALADPDNAGRYRANASSYLTKLDALRTRIHTDMQGIKTRKIITFHEAFPYFAREFGLEVVAVIEREPGSEPGAMELANIIDIVRNSGILALFVEPQYPAKSAAAIARETGATLYALDPAVSGNIAPDSYLRTMEANLATLKEALQ
jgi:zinc transport system substrate-binding protein